MLNGRACLVSPPPALLVWFKDFFFRHGIGLGEKERSIKVGTHVTAGGYTLFYLSRVRLDTDTC